MNQLESWMDALDISLRCSFPPRSELTASLVLVEGHEAQEIFQMPRLRGRRLLQVSMSWPLQASQTSPTNTVTVDAAPTQNLLLVFGVLYL